MPLSSVAEEKTSEFMVCWSNSNKKDDGESILEMAETMKLDLNPAVQYSFTHTRPRILAVFALKVFLHNFGNFVNFLDPFFGRKAFLY